jgi:hypothetical protein
MKKLLLKVAAMAALFTIVGCGSHDGAEDDIKWSDDNDGTLEVVNLSKKDVILFHGQVPMPESIMGGVRAGASSRIFDVSKYVSDFGAGGYMILRGITREQYNEHRYNLSEAKVEFNAFATYKADTKYRIEINYDYTGDNAFRVTNTGRIGLELRKNSPDGEKVSYLPALEVNQMIYTQTTNAITLFPVYVFYNKSTQTINTIHATSHFEAVMATPQPVSGNRFQTYTFPNDPTLSWERIVGSLEYPVAYIKVYNDVRNQSVYFTTGGANHLISQTGYDAVGSGLTQVFEVEASKVGVQRDLSVKVYNGAIEIPVLFEGETTRPIIKNGYDYTVTINGSGQDAREYTATIVEVGERDLNNLLESL